MSISGDAPKPAAEWHRLLAPLPASATVRREPVGAGTQSDPTGPIRGWEQYVIELAEGLGARRVLQVVTDASGELVSAGDHVMTMLRDSGEFTDLAPADGPPSATQSYFHESVGGRFEADGGFQGTHWRMWTVVAVDDDGRETEAGQNLESLVPAPEKRAATVEEARELRRLATEVIVRDHASRGAERTARRSSSREG